MQHLKEILSQVAGGTLPVEDAVRQLASLEDLGFARVDTERLRRCGLTEVIYGPGKTPDHFRRICLALIKAGQNVLATRVSAEQVAALREAAPSAVYHPTARALTVDVAPLPAPAGRVAVVCAGTSDLPVAEEAALTAERMGARVDRIRDVGVAGLHRLVKQLDAIRAARVVVAVAGMEGALPSVIGGLVRSPVIAVPTSVGYGANLGGIAALLAMLNSCAPGVTVVNIDNGFGAGVAAALINRLGERDETASV
jgi:pyridinium-3,5-biscarboxylic acid mononucleotide synthase